MLFLKPDTSDNSSRLPTELCRQPWCLFSLLTGSPWCFSNCTLISHGLASSSDCISRNHLESYNHLGWKGPLKYTYTAKKGVFQSSALGIFF